MENFEKNIAKLSSKEFQHQEIERKFLVKELPADLNKYSNEDIIQGYLIINENKTENRIRQKGNKYFQTIKIGSGKIRTESETEITKEQFDSLWKLTKGKRIEKTRYNIPYKNTIIELDIYHGDLNGLLTAEIEFSNEDNSNNFTPPEWLSEEITTDEKYKNSNLAIYGMPKTNK